MSKFKVGDRVRCIYGFGKAYSPTVGVQTDKEYIVEALVRDFGIYVKGVSAWAGDERFEFVEEGKPVNSNPAIEEYTKTVTVRKLRPSSILKFNDGDVSILKGKRVSLMMKNTQRNCYSVRMTADELRTLAGQLAEIADVMDGNGGV